MSVESPEPTYMEVIVEARVNKTEFAETIEKILKKFVQGDIMVDERFDGTYLVIRDNSEYALQVFGDWIRQARLLDTVRRRLLKGKQENITSLYFNRQAAFMNRLALVDFEDQPPLGPILLQVISDGLEYIIDQVAPRTFNGKEQTPEKWEKIKEQMRRKKVRRIQEKERDQARIEKFRSS